MLKKSFLLTVLFSQLLSIISPVSARGPSGFGNQASERHEEAAVSPRMASLVPLSEEAAAELLAEITTLQGEKQRARLGHFLDFREPAYEQNYEILRPLLWSIAQQPAHLCHADAIEHLWYEAGEEAERNHMVLHPFLLDIAQNPAHPNQWIDLATI